MTVKFSVLQRIKNEIRSCDYLLEPGQQHAEFRPQLNDVQKLVDAYQELSSISLAINIHDAAGEIERLNEAMLQLGPILSKNHRIINHD